MSETNQPTTPRRPWQRPRPRPRQPDVLVRGVEPLAQITIYEDLTLLTRRSGAHWRQYPIDASALAQTLGRVPHASGLLPPHTLGTGLIHGTPFYVVFVPPGSATLRTTQEAWTIPLPPLIWAGHQQDYRIWALGTPDAPADTREQLYAAPFPNCHADGGICWGSSDPRPAAAPSTLMTVLKLFLEESLFNLHLADHKSLGFPNSVIAQWAQLAESGADAYPLDDLVSTHVLLGWPLTGGPWGGDRL